MEHYYTSKPTSKIIEHTYSQKARNISMVFTTASGLFSQKQIDTGSLLLIDECICKNSWKILDLGCGYGPIGITLKKSYPNINVTFTDINTRAIEYVKKNLLLNNVEINETIELVNGDGFGDISGLYDAIYLNPPQSAGKELCLRLIEQSRDFLNANGNLQIVARKNKGGESLSQHMLSVFGNVDCVAKRSGFWIYISYKK